MINGGRESDVAGRIVDRTGHGAHVSIGALGHRQTRLNSIQCRRKRGRHIQVGLVTGEDRTPAGPMDRVIAGEFEIIGSHGMRAYRYERMLDMILNGSLHPEALIADTIALEDAAVELARLDQRREPGILVIDRF